MISHFTGRAAKFFLLSSIAAVLMTGFAFAAENNIAIGAGSTTGSSLRLRAEATTESSVVTTLNKSVAVAILDNSNPDWYRISYNGNTGYVSTDFLVVDKDNVFTSFGRVNGDGVSVRDAASTDGKLLASVNKGTYVTVNGLVNGWYDVTCEYGTKGYIRSDFLDLTETDGTSGTAIVDEAMKHLGTRYVYGGAAPGGFDCSGFTMYLFSKQGISLPHTASGQWQSGVGTQVYGIGELVPGDLVFFNDPSRNKGKACSHAGLYIGDNQFIHASSARSGGVKISSLGDGYYNRYFKGGIHV